MDKVKLFTHARKIHAGGGYKIPQYYTKGGCCHLEKAISTEREVNAY